MVKRSRSQKQKTKLSAAEADLLAMKLRRENLVASHKAVMEEYKVRDMIRTAEKIKNYQNQYGALQQAHSRLPIGLQGPALQRMKDLGTALEYYNSFHNPLRFPRGPGYRANEFQDIERRLA